MQWFKAHASLMRHPKKNKLAELLQEKLVIHYLYGFFSFLTEFAENGEVTGFTSQQISDACEWKGEAKVFFEALLETGFLEKREDSRVFAHDWMQENGYHIREFKRKQGIKKERGKSAKGARGSVKKSAPTVTVTNTVTTDLNQDKTQAPASPVDPALANGFESKPDTAAAYVAAWIELWHKHKPGVEYAREPRANGFIKDQLARGWISLGVFRDWGANYLTDIYKTAGHTLWDFAQDPNKWASKREPLQEGFKKQEVEVKGAYVLGKWVPNPNYRKAS